MSYLKLHYNIFVDLLEYDFSLAYSESVTSHISILNLRQMKISIYRMAMLSITSLHSCMASDKDFFLRLNYYSLLFAHFDGFKGSVDCSLCRNYFSCLVLFCFQ